MQNETPQLADDGISLRDIVNFFKYHGKKIISFGIAGLILASAYVIFAPKKYEASWQMQMAQMSSNSNIEEPAALVQRLRSPTTYSIEVQQVCGMPKSGEFGEYLNKKLEVQPVKNMTTAVEMKLRTSNHEQTKRCAEQLVSMIITQQSKFAEAALATTQAQLIQYVQTLAEEQRQLEKSNKSQLGSLDVLLKIDKIRWLREQIDAAQQAIKFAQMNPTKLLVPIYAPAKPVSTKLELTLIFGLLLGLMLGVLYALAKEIWRKVS